MKDADYKHRPLIAMSTTGKLSPIPTRTEAKELKNPPKVARVAKPRIAAVQPGTIDAASEGSIDTPQPSKTVAIKNFLKGLVKKKE